MQKALRLLQMTSTSIRCLLETPHLFGILLELGKSSLVGQVGPALEPPFGSSLSASKDVNKGVPLMQSQLLQMLQTLLLHCVLHVIQGPGCSTGSTVLWNKRMELDVGLIHGSDGVLHLRNLTRSPVYWLARKLYEAAYTPIQSP